MSTLALSSPPAPYEDLAGFYDVLSPRASYATWIGNIERVAIDCGLRGRRVLDLACGTGHSVVPWIDRGYTVTGCDHSPAMLALAADRTGGNARLDLADLRDLPVLGHFDLITCLNDSLNHLAGLRDFRSALRGMAANLASGGLIVFDLNTLATLRTTFSNSWIRETDDQLVVWSGLGPQDLSPGETTTAHIELFQAADPDRTWIRRSLHLTERHYPLQAVSHELHGVGLEVRRVLGQRRGGDVGTEAATEDDFKALFVAGRSRGLAAWALAHGHEGGDAMRIVGP